MKDPANTHNVALTSPDYIGFIFHPGSKRYVGANPEMVLFQQVPAGIMKAGVFVNEKPERIIELAFRFSLDIVQLHGAETARDCQSIRHAGFKVIKAFGLSAAFNFSNLIPFLTACDYFLFDTLSDQHGGSGRKFDWDKIMEYGFDIPFFLSGGIGPGDADSILKFRHPAFYGVDINSRFESEPGVKDPQQIMTFIKEIKTLES